MRLSLFLLSAVWIGAITAAARGDETDAPPASEASAKTAGSEKVESDLDVSAGEKNAELAETVRKLIRELDAAQKSRRVDAEAQLVALGAKILDYLPENTDRMPAEVRERLNRVRAKLEKSQAENTVEPTSITLSGEQPLSKILAAIENQTGNKVTDLREEFGQDVGDPKLKVDFKQTPFWQAFDQVLDQAGLSIYPYAAEGGGVGLVSRSETQLPRSDRATYAGAFRIEATEFTARRDLRDPMSHNLSLLLEAAWEPRLQPIVVMQPMESISAVDENGQPIPVAASGNEMEIGVDADMKSIELPIQFELPERTSRRLASLKGKLTAMLPGRIETFRFANLEKAKRVERKRADLTVVLEDVRKNDAVWEVRVLLVFEKATGALESHRSSGWVAGNPAFLEGPDKQLVPYAGLETTRETETEAGVAYKFVLPKGLKGYTFVYKTPTAIVSLPIDYELKDLDLP